MATIANLKPNQFINDRYKVVAAINHGSFGSVFLAKDTWARNSLVAIKCINKQKGDPQALQEARDEITIHKRLGNHKYICSLIDNFEDDEATYLVMEYCSEGDLYEAIRAGKGPGPSEVFDFMLQLIEAVGYAHSRGVYHRDIKPENILISSDGSVRLADWGLATTHRINTEFGVGSERYMAPELFDQNNIDSYDAEKVDIWSIGICLLNVLFARNPFTSACQKDKLFLDFASSREALFDIFPSLSDDTFTALRHSLTLDPDNRSLEEFREALFDVEMWTTDEEDDYYDDEDEYVSRNVSLSDVSSPITIEDKAEPELVAPITIASDSATDAPVTVPSQDLPALATTAPPKPTVVRPLYNTPTTPSMLSVNLLSTSTSSFPLKPHNIVPTSNNREPLRTPSALSQQIISESMLSTTWNRTMQFTPPNPSYFSDARNSAANSGGNSKRGMDYIKSPTNYNRPANASRLMESVTEEDFGDHDEVFAMDEIDSALNDLASRNIHDDTSSMYSVPSLVPSQDCDDASSDALSSVNSSRRSAMIGTTNSSLLRKVSVSGPATQKQVLSSSSSTMADKLGNASVFEKTSLPMAIPKIDDSFRDAGSLDFGKSWADLAGDDDDDDDDDDFDIYKVIHALETTPMYVGSPTNPMMRVPVSDWRSSRDVDDPHSDSLDDADDVQQEHLSSIDMIASDTPTDAGTLSPHKKSSTRLVDSFGKAVSTLVPAPRRQWVSTWS